MTAGDGTDLAVTPSKASREKGERGVGKKRSSVGSARRSPTPLVPVGVRADVLDTALPQPVRWWSRSDGLMSVLRHVRVDGRWQTWRVRHTSGI